MSPNSLINTLSVLDMLLSDEYEDTTPMLFSQLSGSNVNMLDAIKKNVPEEIFKELGPEAKKLLAEVGTITITEENVDGENAIVLHVLNYDFCIAFFLDGDEERYYHVSDDSSNTFSVVENKSKLITKFAEFLKESIDNNKRKKMYGKYFKKDGQVYFIKTEPEPYEKLLELRYKMPEDNDGNLYVGAENVTQFELVGFELKEIKELLAKQAEYDKFLYELRDQVRDRVHAKKHPYDIDGDTIYYAKEVAKENKIDFREILAGMRPTGAINRPVWDETGKIVPYKKIFGR